MNNEKAKNYAGLVALLEHEGFASIAMSVSLRDIISRELGITEKEFESHMNYAYKNLDKDTSTVCIDWKIGK